MVATIEGLHCNTRTELLVSKQSSTQHSNSSTRKKALGFRLILSSKWSKTWPHGRMPCNILTHQNLGLLRSQGITSLTHSVVTLQCHYTYSETNSPNKAHPLNTGHCPVQTLTVSVLYTCCCCFSPHRGIISGQNGWYQSVLYPQVSLESD